MAMQSVLPLFLMMKAADGFLVSHGLTSNVEAARLRTPLATSLRMGGSLTEPARSAPLVAGNPIPRVYVYDHCPFCVRVRFVLGLKNIKHNVIFLANDDVETPTKLVIFHSFLWEYLFSSWRQ